MYGIYFHDGRDVVSFLEPIECMTQPSQLKAKIFEISSQNSSREDATYLILLPGSFDKRKND